MRHRRLTAALVAAAIGAAATGCTGIERVTAVPDCTVVGDDHLVELDFEQAANAATITAVGVRRDLPPQAMVVALATAWQESKLHNIDYGDRDSLGLFQQRPSQGWGSEEDVMDPRYAANAFYEHLERVPDWESMRVTDAAQTVQRSAFPEEYQQWADDSRVMVDAFLGAAPEALRCVQRTVEESATTDLGEALRLDWGDEPTVEESDDGLTVSVDSRADGWRFASWFVAHSTERGVAAVEFDGSRWHADSGEWTRPEAGGADDARVVVVLR